MEIKHSLNKFMRDLTKEKAKTRLDIKLESAWRKSTINSNRKVHVVTLDQRKRN